jgi:hypothetical protein
MSVAALAKTIVYPFPTAVIAIACFRAARQRGMAKQERSPGQTAGRDVYVCLMDLGLN